MLLLITGKRQWQVDTCLTPSLGIYNFFILQFLSPLIQYNKTIAQHPQF